MSHMSMYFGEKMSARVNRMHESVLRDYTRNTEGFSGPGFAIFQKAVADELKDRAKHEKTNRKETLDYWEAIDYGISKDEGDWKIRWIKYATEAEASEAMEGWLDYCEHSRSRVAWGQWFAGGARQKGNVVLLTLCLNV